MATKNNSNEINWLIHSTGDPFADIGGLVIEYLQEKNPGKSIMELIEKVTNIYVKNWGSKLHSFFYNSKITHNSIKGTEGIGKTLTSFKDLFEGVGATQGYCRITGQRGKVFNGSRDNYIMSGSAALINFHHGFESGLKLSKEAIIRAFFVPMASELLTGQVVIVMSNNENIPRYFVRKNVDSNLRDIASGISKSIKKSDFSNAITALFDYATQCIENVKTATYDEESQKSITEGTTLNLFHFTNFSSDVTISLYTLPATIFAFYAYCITEHKKDWQNFVYRFYSSSKFKNAQFNDTNQRWESAKEIADHHIFRTWRNSIFENLLNEKSILSLFLHHSKKHLISFRIIEQYQINIQNMDKRTLTKIKQLADFIVNNRSDDEIKKSMTRLNASKNSSGLRYFLLKLADKNYKDGNEKPLFSLDEYVEYLFPDGTYWNEIRDLLLIAIYQKLHESNKKIEVDLIEIESEI